MREEDEGLLDSGLCSSWFAAVVVAVCGAHRGSVAQFYVGSAIEVEDTNRLEFDGENLELTLQAHLH